MIKNWDLTEHFHHEAFGCLCENIFVSWIGQCLLELIVVKTLQIYKFSWVSGINDDFFGRFLFLANLVSQVVAQLFRYQMGSFYESREFQLFSGIRVSYVEVYWTFFPVIFIMVFCFASFSITGKSWFIDSFHNFLYSFRKVERKVWGRKKRDTFKNWP